jgi:hypothetical protein
VSDSSFIMRWPELGKQVRVRPIEHNRKVFDWFVENLPARSLQGHTVVAGFALCTLNLFVRKAFPWRATDFVRENFVAVPMGRLTFFTPGGRIADIGCKWGEISEPMSYITWAEVVEQDKPIVTEVGQKIWSIFMGNDKSPIVHVEYLKTED